jgi:alpha-1,3-rhamnosyl/mannosyltransferase
MIVGVEARVALLGNRGWARYTKEIVAALSAFEGLELRVLAPDNGIAKRFAHGLGDRSNVRFRFAPFAPASPNEYWSSPERARLVESWLGRVDLLHSMTRFTPPTEIRPVVATVHDIAPLSDPPFKQQYYSATLQALQTLQGPGYSIIAVSHFTKWELAARGGLDLSDVVVIHEGVSEIFRSFKRDCATEARSLPAEYLLYVGGAGPNKNLSRLLSAAAELYQRRGTNLVLVGDASWGYDVFMPTALSSEWLHFCGYVDDRQLAGIYRGAAALVCPSIHEGFGLPLVEAMACGTPILCSRIPVHQEVAGDAALYFDPCSTREIIECVLRLVTDPSLERVIRSRGLKRSSTFSWGSAASRTVDVYQRRLAGRAAT